MSDSEVTVGMGKIYCGSGGEGNDGSGDVVDGQFGRPAIINDHDTPKSILGVTPPLQEGFPVKGDFATCVVEKYLASCVAQDGNGEEIVDKAGELMSWVCFRWQVAKQQIDGVSGCAISARMDNGDMFVGLCGRCRRSLLHEEDDVPLKDKSWIW